MTKIPLHIDIGFSIAAFNEVHGEKPVKLYINSSTNSELLKLYSREYLEKHKPRVANVFEGIPVNVRMGIPDGIFLLETSQGELIRFNLKYTI